MDKYIITIKKDKRAYIFSRYYNDDYDRALVMDILEALFHLHLIDEFIVKEVSDEDTDTFLRQ